MRVFCLCLGLTLILGTFSGCSSGGPAAGMALGSVGPPPEPPGTSKEMVKKVRRAIKFRPPG